MKYERITERVGEGGGELVHYKYGVDKTLGQCLVNILGRLAEIEDKIESGVLVELPCNCNLGDLVYGVADYLIKPKLGILTYVEITKYCIRYGIVDKRLMRHDVEYVYSTAEKEEAEKKLEELKNK